MHFFPMDFAPGIIKRLYASAAFTVFLVTVFLLASTAAFAQDSGEGYADVLRNEFSEGIDQLLESSFFLKLWIIVALAIAAITLYLRNRDTPGNNTRRARTLHKKAVASHERGDAEEAAEYYRKAAAFREKAEVRE